MGRLTRRVEELEGAVLPERAQVLHVVDTDASTAGEDYLSDSYTFTKPAVMAGQTVTKAELDRLFPDAEVIELLIVYGEGYLHQDKHD